MPSTNSAFAVACLALACSRPTDSTGSNPSSPEPTVPTLSPQQVTPPAEPVTASMRAHFGRSLAMMDSLIAGDLGGARRELEKLSVHAATLEPPRGRTVELDHIRKRAKEPLASLDDAAAALAYIGVQCGTCHRALAVSIPAKASAEPPFPDNAMLVHAWASDRLWMGAALADTAMWAKGTAALVESIDKMSQDRGSLRQVAMAAAAVDDPLAAERELAGVFATCAGCHRTSR